MVHFETQSCHIVSLDKEYSVTLCALTTSRLDDFSDTVTLKNTIMITIFLFFGGGGSWAFF